MHPTIVSIENIARICR